MSSKQARAARRLAVPPLLSIAPPAEPRPRFAHRFAKYVGDVSAEVMDAPVMGPNTFGEPMVALYAHHDPVEDRTRVGFTFASPADVNDQMQRELQQIGGQR